MNLSHPYKSVSPALDGEVLNVLTYTDLPLTGRDIARLAGRKSHSGVQSVLRRLVHEGIVHRQEAGSSLLFRLNREHVAAPAIESLAGIRGELISRITMLVETWSPSPVHVSLFGSFARGDGTSESDIDVFVVRPEGVNDDEPNWVEQVDHLRTAIQRWTGNVVDISEVSAADLSRLAHDRPPIVANLLDDSVTVAGVGVSELLGG